MKVQGLTENQMARIAPSIFASNPIEGVSDRYQFIPTISVVRNLQREGWFPTKVQECRVRSDENRGFQKHLIRFSREEMILNGERIELVLVNSHNRSAAYQLMVGVYRLICSNGMIVGDTFNKVSVKHINFNPAEIVEASFQIAENASQISDSLNEMKAIGLTQPERKIYAESAALVLYDDIEDCPFEPGKLLKPKRYQDHNLNDLWHTFNIVQENIMKGKIRGHKQDKKGHLKRTSTRKITSIDKDIKVNKALWNLTEKMKELKSN